MTKKTPSRPKKPSARRKAAKKTIVIRVELPPVTKAQRDALAEMFETAAVAVLGVSSTANVNKKAVLPRPARRARRPK